MDIVKKKNNDKKRISNKNNIISSINEFQKISKNKYNK